MLDRFNLLLGKKDILAEKHTFGFMSEAPDPLCSQKVWRKIGEFKENGKFKGTSGTCFELNYSVVVVQGMFLLVTPWLAITWHSSKKLLW